MTKALRIGFIASRLSGTDGVSLEAKKWFEVLNRKGYECFCFCSNTDWPQDRAYICREAGLSHEKVWEINRRLFTQNNRTEKTGRCISGLKRKIKKEIRAFVQQFDINLFIVENAFSLPMNIPLGLAVAEYIAEQNVRTIAHHHDFWWERDRYAGSPAVDYLASAFPPCLNAIRHVVINSVAERELAFRTGVKSTQIPNVMDFADPPEEPDDYSADLREQIGVRDHEKLILQPTRIVPRKRIEKAIELVRRLETDSALVITHHAGDEGHEYVRYLREIAAIMNIRLLMPAERFNAQRGLTPDGDKVYSLKDAYQHADLITYCSVIEGFGNAFLETVYYKRPMIMSAYEIFSLDIEPKGFQVLSFRDFIGREMIRETDRLLAHRDIVAGWTEQNYELGRRYYSFESLEQKLDYILKECAEQ